MSHNLSPPGVGTGHYTPPDPSPSTSSYSFSTGFNKSSGSPHRSSFAVPSSNPTPGPSNGSTPAASRRNTTSQREIEAAEAEAKRRKIQRACDVCRRKKIRCEDATSGNGSKCANCQEFGLECTYVEAAKRRGPPKGYIDTLEQRCHRLEAVLHQLHPGVDFTSTVGPLPDKDEFELSEYQNTLRGLGIPPYPAMKPYHSPSSSRSTPQSHHQLAAAAPSPISNVLGISPWKPYEQDPNRPPESPPTEHEDMHMQAAIAQAFNKLEIKDSHWRFHGKASPHHLIMHFNELRYAKSGRHVFENVAHHRREEYWYVPEWEQVISSEGSKPVDFSIWPEAGFDQTLIDSYFEYTNDHFPLLNQIIFNRQYQAGLYLTSRDFAKVCLMVFANGARYVDDERVYWPVDSALTEEGKERLRSDADGTRKYSAGWKYLQHLLRIGRDLMQSPGLFDFQCQVLICAFLLASAIPHLPWIISGVGIRAAQELGIHVRSILVHADPVERALYNRAFWCLYHIDRFNCSAIGRSVAIQDTDFDADYPIAVDDEYWETGNPDTDFVQPPLAGISKITAFVQTLKLDHIIGAALRTIYAIQKSPEQTSNATGQRAIVAELDSALNSWADGVPDQLRWDPTRSDLKLFNQSAESYVYYYYCQILVHRQYIPTARHPETIGLPSLAICSNAARSICNIIDAVLKRGRQYSSLPGRILPVQFMLPAWIACIVLLINIYTGKPNQSDRDRALLDIKKAIAAMKDLELTWRQAGKLTDVMVQIANEVEAGDMEDDLPHGQKRPYDPASDTPSHHGLYSLCRPPTKDDPTPGPLQPPPHTPPAFWGQWSGGTLFSADHVSADPTIPAVPLAPDSLIDSNIFDPFNEQFGAIPSYEAPATTGEEGDMWAQLFSWVMQPPAGNQQSGYQAQ